MLHPRLRVAALCSAIILALVMPTVSSAQSSPPDTAEPIPATPLPDDKPIPATPLSDDEPIPAAPLPDAAAVAPPADGEISDLSGVTVESQYTAGGDVLYLDEQRTASGVTEAIGAAQISRTGDSDVAQTLRRVTGLSVVNGKYVYVRGLGERYSSVLLNGAQIPSPDFTRRVIPLDLFPNALLDGIIIEKTYLPRLPGDFGGGTVQLRTREVPTEFFLSVGGGLGYTDGTTGKDGLRYRGGALGWAGYDDGARAMPDSLAAATADGTFLRPMSPANPDGATPADLQQYGQALAAEGYGIYGKRIPANTGYSFSIGDSFHLADDIRFGVIATTRYRQVWDSVEEKRNTYAASDAGLTRVADADVDYTIRNIDVSYFLGMGMAIGNNHYIGLTNMLLRQTFDRAKISDGSFDSVDSRYSETKWTANQLRATQLHGHDLLPGLHDLEFDWQYTKASAGRNEPNTRQWRYDYSGDVLEYSRRSDANSQTFGKLADNQDDFSIRAMLPVAFDDGWLLELSTGGGRLTRDRNSSIRTFTFQLAPGSPLPAEPGFFEQPIGDILAVDNISPDGFVLRETTRATDTYSASQDLKAAFFNADFNFRGVYRFTLGARNERNDQNVTTYSIINPAAPPIVSTDQGNDWLPAASFTWIYSENAQLRAAYSKTVSRPDFRELSPAPFTDPELDIDTIGNPDLQTAHIRNFDLRWEYYFSDSDSLSIAAFDKKFDMPIEILRLAGSSPLASFSNADSAHNYGLEFEVSKGLGFVSENWSKFKLDDFSVGLNYARIRSNVQLDPESASFQTNLSRPMQGQSPYVANLQLGYQHPGNGLEATLLFNRFGDRISEVGVQGQPDIYQQALSTVDFQFRQVFAIDWRWTLRLRNLLDPEVQFTQGGLPTRQFHAGREIAFGLEWRPGSDQ